MRLQVNVGFAPNREHLKQIVLYNLEKAKKLASYRITICNVDSLVKNNPLHEKYNFMTKYGKANHDFVMKLDGDTLVHEDIFLRLEAVLKQKPAIIGFTRILFFDINQFQIKETTGDPVGSCIVNSDYADSYFTEGNRHTAIFKKIQEKGGILHNVSDKPYMIDIKDGLNIWRFDQIGGKTVYL